MDRFEMIHLFNYALPHGMPLTSLSKSTLFQYWLVYDTTSSSAFISFPVSRSRGSSFGQQPPSSFSCDPIPPFLSHSLQCCPMPTLMFPTLVLVIIPQQRVLSAFTFISKWVNFKLNKLQSPSSITFSSSQRAYLYPILPSIYRFLIYSPSFPRNYSKLSFITIVISANTIFFTRSAAQSLTHLFNPTPSHTHSLTHLVTHSLISSLMSAFTHSFTQSSIHSLTHALTQWFTHSRAHSHTHLSTPPRSLT